MALTREHLQEWLGARPVRFYARAGSTNDLALDWLRAGAPSGAVVIADEQISGRGRQGRSWQTPPGAALAVSLILKPALAALPRLSLLGALAVAEMIEGLGIAGVGIKWPNDVQIKGLKVCGVLPEAVWNGDALMGAVLGIGVNVRVDFQGTALEGTATSLQDWVGRRLDRAELVHTLLTRVDAWYERLDAPALLEAWQARLITLGLPVQVGEVNGIAEGVDVDGALLVRSADGTLHRVVSGDVLPGAAAL